HFKGIGISAGSVTFLHMATQQPPRVEAMILIGAASYFPEEARKLMGEATVESLTPQQWERFRQIHKHGDDQIRALRGQYHNFKDSYEDVNFTPPYEEPALIKNPRSELDSPLRNLEIHCA
ncbi:MAG: hypothetical protein L0312_29390, partial [Acidobacteria bacterium]|nr:hypothetical protein [Acidobacteriota bacterium]